jgi:ATP-dependent helicase/nuclease subunit A
VEFHLIARAGEDDNGDEAEEAASSAGEIADLLATEREARLVAQRLQALKNERLQVWDDGRKTFRDAQWGDMAVLLRSPSGRAEAFAKEFSKAGVPLVAARDGFFASLEVSDLLNLLKLLDNPLQDVPLLAVLRSPLAGLSLDELAEVRAHNPARPFWTALARFHRECQGAEIKCAARAKTDLFLQQFSRWRELARQTSLSQCLETALADTHYEALLLAGERGAERAANVRQLLDLARQFDPYQRQGLYRFLRFVQAQEDEELDLQPPSAQVGDAVRLMSIHKSKGLEFPVVALAGLGTRFNEQDLYEPVLLDEFYGLCPKITPPGTDQSYPGLPHWLARRGERRALRGEELRLFYVALSRARDHILLVGTTNRKAEDAVWESSSATIIGTRDVVGAHCQLDWLSAWLPQATAMNDWCDARGGENRLLRWNIYPENDAVFAGIATGQKTADTPAPANGETAAAVEQLKARLAWQYPFAGATTEAAKTSVSALRRRMADEVDEEARRWFVPRSRRTAAIESGAESISRPDSLPMVGTARRAVRAAYSGAIIPSPDLPAGRSEDSETSAIESAKAAVPRLTATERGTAHHLFLQFVELERAGSEADLKAEAERLRQAGLLTPEQSAALDFKALAAFWQSDAGRKIRANARFACRELPFTARFSPDELTESSGVPPDTTLAAEFVVVQGVADLAVILPQEIWLVDFKTDEVKKNELAEKTTSYELQLKLYARALSRIYRRPVTNCLLYFLARGTAVPVKI